MLALVLSLIFLAVRPVVAGIHQVTWSIDYVLANPDGLFPRRVIRVNNSWPPPPIEMSETDVLKITTTNHLDVPISLTVHGMALNLTSDMSGVIGVGGCGIPPGATFTYIIPVDTSGQSGTYWIHGYSTGHADGLRAPLIVLATNEIFMSKYDLEATVTLGDWYHQEYPALLKQYIGTANPSGIVPPPDSGLVYYSQNGAYLAPRSGSAGTAGVGMNENSTLLFTRGKRYRLRVINVGISATFYFWIDSHTMTVIEADGVAVQPFQTSMLSVFVGQRYSILVTASQPAASKHAVHANMDPDAFGSSLSSSLTNLTSSITYVPVSPLSITNLGPIAAYTPISDMSLFPVEWQAAPFVDLTIEVNASASLMDDGTNRTLFNQLVYNRPLVPALFSALSLADPRQADAYGPSTFVLVSSKDYEIIVNNLSGRRLPFHLHGHTLMILSTTSKGGLPVTGPLDNPSRRDVVAVPAGGSVRLRFTADNPGAWLFQALNTFYLDAGLAVQFIESVDQISRTRISDASVDLCRSQGFPISGNAAGHDNPADLSGWSQGPFLPTTVTSASASASTTVFSSTTDTSSGVYNTASDTFTADPPTATSPPNSNDTQFEPEYSALGASTFIFLTDPQQWRSDPDNERLNGCSALNVQLNMLDSGSTWPTNFPISVPGQQIGAITAVVFGGDMCQTGGDYSALDQALGLPPTYTGGIELVRLQALYQPGAPNSPGVTALKYAPKYFGLGNHDVQTDFHPPVGWSEGSLHFSSPNNFWRYQMWNFITQMHTGYPSQFPAVYPIAWQNIDSDFGDGTFQWKDHSLNYVIDMGPFDLIQLHRYGNDSEFGRQSGLAWVQNQLAERGSVRPIIIAQHYLFSQTCDTGGICPSWTSAQRDALLQVLAPYNIIAFVVGHAHGTGPLPNWINITSNGLTRQVPEFRPGAAFDQNAALIRVTPSVMDVVYGNTRAGKGVVWTDGATFNLTLANQIWVKFPNNNANYFGSLKSIYVDTRVVRAPAGQSIFAVSLTRAGDVTNRLSWQITAGNTGGTNLQNITVSGDSTGTYFPGKGGMSGIYVDLSPVSVPPGSVAVGVYFWQKGNRIAPGIVAQDLGTGAESNITNSDFAAYFPPTGGSSKLYANTNMVNSPTGSDLPVGMVLAGVAFYQQANQIALRALYI